MSQTLLGNLTVIGPSIHSEFYDNGNSGTSITIDCDNGNYQKVTLNNNCTITLKNTTGIGTKDYTVPLVLLLVQDATGGRVITWDAYGDGLIYWGAGQAGSHSTGANDLDLVFAVGHFYGAGSDLDWFCSIMHDFQ